MEDTYNKPSFILYKDMSVIFNGLSKEDAGELIQLIFSYVNGDKLDIDNNPIRFAFLPIKQQLRRDLDKYNNICDRNKANGSKGGRPNKPKEPTGFSGNPNKPQKADNGNGNENDNEIIPIELINHDLSLCKTKTALKSLVRKMKLPNQDEILNEIKYIPKDDWNTDKYSVLEIVDKMIEESKDGKPFEEIRREQEQVFSHIWEVPQV